MDTYYFMFLMYDVSVWMSMYTLVGGGQKTSSDVGPHFPPSLRARSLCGSCSSAMPI